MTIGVDYYSTNDPQLPLAVYCTFAYPWEFGIYGTRSMKNLTIPCTSKSTNLKILYFPNSLLKFKYIHSFPYFLLSRIEFFFALIITHFFFLKIIN